MSNIKLPKQSGFTAAVAYVLDLADESLATFDRDPADSDYQREYERGLKAAREALIALVTP